MKKNILRSILLMVLCLAVMAGCGSNYGDKIFKCSSKNLLGFEGIYNDGNTFTIKIETKNDMSSDYPDITFSKILSSGRLGSSDKFYLVTKNAVIMMVDNSNVTMNSVDGTITFTLDGCDPSEIRNIHFSGDGYAYDIDIVLGEIEVLIDKKDNYGLYMQSYDSSKWSSVSSLGG